jgi:hypothetical protein
MNNVDNANDTIKLFGLPYDELCIVVLFYPGENYYLNPSIKTILYDDALAVHKIIILHGKVMQLLQWDTFVFDETIA